MLVACTLQHSLSNSKEQTEKCVCHSRPVVSLIGTACTGCPVHIGVVLSDKFNPTCHLESQQYHDVLDGKSRARDSVQWVVLKGDLIPASEPLRKNVCILRRLTQISSPVGSVTLVLSRADQASPARHFSQTGNSRPPTDPQPTPKPGEIHCNV